MSDDLRCDKHPERRVPCFLCVSKNLDEWPLPKFGMTAAECLAVIEKDRTEMRDEIDRLMGVVGEAMRSIEALRKERGEAVTQRQADRAKTLELVLEHDNVVQERDRLQYRLTLQQIKCWHCGLDFGEHERGRDVPEVREHVISCAEHPLAKQRDTAIRERDEARTEVERLLKNGPLWLQHAVAKMHAMVDQTDPSDPVGSALTHAGLERWSCSPEDAFAKPAAQEVVELRAERARLRELCREAVTIASHLAHVPGETTAMDARIAALADTIGDDE